MTKAKMTASAKKVLRSVLEVSKEDLVFIISDDETKDIGEAFKAAAAQLCAKVPTIYFLKEDERPLYALPKDLEKLMDKFKGSKTAGSLVYVNAFQGFLEETPFRLQLIRKQKDERSRVGHAPGISMDMMNDGSMTADYDSILKIAKKLMEAFKEVTIVKLTGPGGTDLVMNIEGRGFETDVRIPKGGIGNLPAGEIWCAPSETDANGIFVCDGSIGDMGPVKEPITISLKNGKVVSIECADMEFGEKVRKALSLDDMSNTIGEFGIGLNPQAKLTGNLLEDEKVGGTAHIACGNNIDMPGGRNNSKTHRDFLMRNPTIEVRYKDGTKAVLIKNGKVNL
jgi:leucyl aminopeptidase (aminopeptidase T)